MLATLPQAAADGGGAFIQVALADVDRAVELAGISRPADPTDPDQVREFVIALRGVSADGPPVSTVFPEVAQPVRIDRVAEFAAELGWSVAEVSWFAEYQVPPHDFAAIGGLDHSRLADALGERPGDGIWRIGGEDYETDLRDITTARPLGQALRLAMVGDHLVIARATPPVVAAQDGGPTLADNPVLSALVAALDAEKAYSAQLLAGPPTVFKPEGPAQQAAGTGLPRPFLGVAAGSTHIDGTPYAVFAYVHVSQEDAEANAAALRSLLTDGASVYTDRPWRERFEVADIRVVGATVVARLGFVDAPPVLPYQVLMERDNLVCYTGDAR